MTTYYVEGGSISIVSFETDPQDDINADAKIWHPKRGAWRDCPGSTGIGTDVLWSGGYYPLPESEVPEFQRRCRVAFSQFKAHPAARKAAKGGYS